MYYVYVLKSEEDHRWYIGFTNNLKQRVMQHREGQVLSTKNRRPLTLLYYEAYLNSKAAVNREKRLKYFGKAYQELKKRIGDM